MPELYKLGDWKNPGKVFKRESIGALANCMACHLTTEKGIYDDDNVKIPK